MYGGDATSRVCGEPARGEHISMLLHRHSCKPLPQLFADVRPLSCQKVLTIPRRSWSGRFISVHLTAPNEHRPAIPVFSLPAHRHNGRQRMVLPLGEGEEEGPGHFLPRRGRPAGYAPRASSCSLPFGARAICKCTRPHLCLFMIDTHDLDLGSLTCSDTGAGGSGGGEGDVARRPRGCLGGGGGRGQGGGGRRRRMAMAREGS